MRGVGSLQTANHPRDQNTRKRQLFHFIFQMKGLATDLSKKLKLSTTVSMEASNSVGGLGTALGSVLLFSS
jgi:hypothetical protein